MGMDFKVNEYGEIIRGDNELFSLELKYLKGVPLNIEVRKRLAAESQNLQVLEACLKERAITIRRIVWANPYLTPELRKEATRQKLLDKKSSTNSKDSSVKPTVVKPKIIKDDLTKTSSTPAPSNTLSKQYGQVMVYGYTETYAANPDVDIFIDDNIVARVGHNSMVPVYISNPCELKFKCSLSFRTTKCYAHPGDVVVLSVSRMSGKLSATLTSQSNYTNVIHSKQNEDSKNSIWVFILLALGSLLSVIFSTM